MRDVCHEPSKLCIACNDISQSRATFKCPPILRKSDRRQISTKLHRLARETRPHNLKYLALGSCASRQSVGTLSIIRAQRKFNNNPTICNSSIVLVLKIFEILKYVYILIYTLLCIHVFVRWDI